MTDRPMLRGLIAATFTPMHADGSLDPGTVPAVVDFLLKRDLGGLFLCGSTGEFTSLTLQERMSITEVYVSAVDGRLPIVVHVGHSSLEEAQVLAAHAAELSVSAIAAAPPTYFRPADVEALAACLQVVAEAAPRTPLYYYHIPALTGVNLCMLDLLEVARERLPTLTGIKFSCAQLDDLLACVRFAGGRYNILFGADEMLLAGMSMGAHGAVGSTYNFLAPLYQQVLAAFECGDLEAAQTAQQEAAHAVRVILSCGGQGALKAAMCVLGVDCGPPRLPIASLNTDQEESLRTGLAPWRNLNDDRGEAS